MTDAELQAMVRDELFWDPRSTATRSPCRQTTVALRLPSRSCAAPPRSPSPRAAPTATGSTGAATAGPTTPCGASLWSGCTATQRPGSMSSGAPNKACPSSTSCAVSSATSPARSTPPHQPAIHGCYRLPEIGGINEPHQRGHDGAERWHCCLAYVPLVASLVGLATAPSGRSLRCSHT